MEENKNNNTKEKHDEIIIENKKLCAENAELKARLDEAIEAKQKAEALITTKINEKLQLLNRVEPYLESVSSYVQHSDRSIMEATINCIRGNTSDFTDYSDDVVKGIYLECMKNADKQKHEKELKKYDTDYEEASNTTQTYNHNNSPSMDTRLKQQVKDDWYKKQYGDKTVN